MGQYSITDPVTGGNLTVEKDGDEPLSQDEIAQVISAHRQRRGVATPDAGPVQGPLSGIKVSDVLHPFQSAAGAVVSGANRFATRSPMMQDIGNAAGDAARGVARSAAGAYEDYVDPIVEGANFLPRVGAGAANRFGSAVINAGRDAGEGLRSGWNRFVQPTVNDVRDVVQNYVLPQPEPVMPTRTNSAPIVATRIQVPVVKDKSDFDALPSGSVYTGQDGRRYRKP